MMDNMVVPSFHDPINGHTSDIENSIINSLQTNNQERQREINYNFPYCLLFVLSINIIGISVIVCYILVKIL